MFRQEVIQALLSKPVEDLHAYGLLEASEDEIRHALSLVTGKRTKARIDALNKELRIRQKPPFGDNFKSEKQKNLFIEEWNKVTALFK